jgi:hypothetical protein
MAQNKPSQGNNNSIGGTLSFESELSKAAPSPYCNMERSVYDHFALAGAWSE